MTAVIYAVGGQNEYDSSRMCLVKNSCWLSELSGEQPLAVRCNLCMIDRLVHQSEHKSERSEQ
jgi:hypothetical protein